MSDPKEVLESLVHAEFGRRHDEAYRKSDLAERERKVRDEALFGTFKKFADDLDRLVVKIYDEGPYYIMYQIQEDLFFRLEKPVDALFKVKKQSSKTDPVTMVEYLNTEKLTVQWTSQILSAINKKILSDAPPKVILPKGFFYFEWLASWAAGGCASETIARGRIIQENTLTMALLKLKIMLFQDNNNVVEKLKVFCGGKSYQIKMFDSDGQEMKSWWHKEPGVQLVVE